MTQKGERIIRILLAAALWLSSVGIIFWFTSFNADDSRQMSLSLAHHIKNVIARFFYVNDKDEFWDTTLNAMLRKFAHFIEFFYHGVTTGILMATLIIKKGIAFASSATICFATAALDEYRQTFIPGRGPQWSDVAIDCAGALTGLIVFFLIYAIYSKIQSLKQRVCELENEKMRNE